MKKIILFVLFVWFLSVFSFPNQTSKVSLLEDFTPILKNEITFKLTLEDIYQADISYYFEISNENIYFSNYDQIVNYFKFYQPGFEISYRNPEDRIDPYFLIENFDGFTMSLDNFMNFSFKNLNLGIIFDKSFFSMSYWTQLTDLSNSKVAMTFNTPKNLGISIGFEEKVKYYFKAGDLLFSTNKNHIDSVYILNKDFRLKYESDTGKLTIDSLYFEKNENNFYFRIPLNKNLFFTFSNLGLGISFYADLYRSK